MKISFLDFAVILIYFAVTLAVGYMVGRRAQSTGQYFLANKSFSGWAIGISLIGSIISSVTFLGIPADSFKTAWLRFLPNLALPIVALIAARYFVPFFRRGTITSAYEYLSLRFGGSISTYAAIAFLLIQVLRTSVIAYLLSLLLEGITGWSFTTCLMVTVGVTAIYTVKGGIKAVVWTDVVQTIVLLLGVVVCIVYIVDALPAGLATIFSDANAHHKLSVAHDYNTATASLERVGTGFSLSEKTVLMLLIAGFVQYLGGQFEQSTVQRWCVATTAAEARRSVYVMGFGCVPVWALFQFLGTALFVYFLHFPDPVAGEIAAGTRKAESIVPYFITEFLPTGLRGLVIAGALAAAMSTLSACINSASMVIVNDLYKKIGPARSDGHYLAVAKGAALAVSLLMIGGALLIYTAETVTLTDLILTLVALISSGVPGIFLAGMLTRRVSLAGAWTGLAASLLFVLWVKANDLGLTPDALRFGLFPYYVAIVGNVLSFGVAYLASLVRPAPTQALSNLTVWDQAETPLE